MSEEQVDAVGPEQDVALKLWVAAALFSNAILDRLTPLSGPRGEQQTLTIIWR